MLQESKTTGTYQSDLDEDFEFQLSPALLGILRDQERLAAGLAKAYGSAIPLDDWRAPSELDLRQRTDVRFLVDKSGVWIDVKEPEKLCALADVAARHLRNGFFVHHAGVLVKALRPDGSVVFVPLPQPWLDNPADLRAAERLRKAGVWVSPKKALNRHLHDYLNSTKEPRW